jgi:hypothetical protein
MMPMFLCIFILGFIWIPTLVPGVRAIAQGCIRNDKGLGLFGILGALLQPGILIAYLIIDHSYHFVTDSVGTVPSFGPLILSAYWLVTWFVTTVAYWLVLRLFTRKGNQMPKI